MDILKLKSYLRKGTVIFRFEKVDGTIREMNGTLSKEFIGDENLPKGDSIAPSRNDNILVVFDVDASGWRSCRIENIKEVFDIELNEWIEFINE